VEKDERAAIAQVVENWNEGWRSKDPALASRDYAVDADWTTAFGMTRHGRDEIEDMMRQVFSLPHVMAGRGEVAEQAIRFGQQNGSRRASSWAAAVLHAPRGVAGQVSDPGA